jgi:hypothetical protein
MKKTRRFQDGGIADENFTADQLKFLGGADRTDPYILARMRSKFPDAPKAERKVEPKAEAEIKTETKQGEHPKIDAATREKALYEKAPRFINKGSNPKSITPDRLFRKDILNEFPGRNGRVIYPTDYDDAGYKSGGKVKSASSRADGCAVRGKTRA